MRHKQVTYDVVVCGGGLAGISAAVSAARLGARTALVHDRPVLGGNSSSEVRVTPHGAARFHAYARETGILSELMCEDRARNHEQFYNNGWTNSIWDMTLYDLVMRTANLDLYVNTAVIAVEKSSERTISAVVGRVSNAETEVTFYSKLFMDCTGDGVIAALAGNEWRMGAEGRSEFNEPHAPESASSETMGSTIHFRAKDMGRQVPFQAPAWAVVYDDPAFFYAHNRKPADIRAGYWWIELSSPWDTIHDAELIRHELTRHVLGIWDWIKNKDPNTRDLAANYALDWIGQVPGKRESRRIMGRYLMTEHDSLNREVFPDEVAFGGWYVDLHIAGGLLGATSELPGSGEICGPYGIPLRILIARDLDNLMMAGRNVSVTHAALGTVRVMATTALMGQAAGTAAAVALRRGLAIADVPEQAVSEVQQTLLRSGCFLPNVEHNDPDDVARRAAVTASSEALSRGTEEGGAGSGEALTTGRTQWIAVRGELRCISVYLSNPSEQFQWIEAKLLAADHIWDYRSAGELPLLGQERLAVPPRYEGWVEWLLHPNEKRYEAGGYVRLDLAANPHVLWHTARQLAPGQPSAYEMEEGVLRSHDNGQSYSFRLSPPQPVFPGASVIQGAARPYRHVNMWRSEPSLPFPQHVELSWEDKVVLGGVELTFPGHLLEDYNRYPAFHREPECPKDYRVEVWSADGWKEVLHIEGNYQRHVRHAFHEAVSTSRIRVVIEATNGSQSAVIYEIRCYERTGN